MKDDPPKSSGESNANNVTYKKLRAQAKQLIERVNDDILYSSIDETEIKNFLYQTIADLNDLGVNEDMIEQITYNLDELNKLDAKAKDLVTLRLACYKQIEL